MRMTWQVAADQNPIWVKVVKAKYCPKQGFWGIKNTQQVSWFWRGIQELKEELIDDTRWQIGDGQNIPALNQPWFQGWEIQQIRSNEQVNTTVC